MGCSGSVSLGLKLSLALNSAARTRLCIIGSGEECGSKRRREPNVDKSFGDKDQKIDVFELPPQKALID